MLLVVWIATLAAFIIFWWLKRNSRLKAGENYKDDENYKSMSTNKKITGIACILSFILFVIFLQSNSDKTDNKTNVTHNQKVEVVKEPTIYDETASILIIRLNSAASEKNFTLSKPQYYESGNNKYCTVVFRGSESNKLNLKLNQDDSVIYAEIICPSDNFDNGVMTGIIMSGLIISASANKDEFNQFLNQYANIDVQTAFLTLRELEHKLIDDEMIFYNAPIDNNVSNEVRNKMIKIKSGFQEWAKQK